MKSVLCVAAMAAALLSSTAMVSADNLDTLGKFNAFSEEIMKKSLK